MLFRGTGEDYFLATRTIGPFLLLMSLFGTHMTAFSLLGASGEAYRTGIGVFALMASSSALVVPVVFYFIGVPGCGRSGNAAAATSPRCSTSASVGGSDAVWAADAVSCVLIVLLIPYLLIGVMGSGI